MTFDIEFMYEQDCSIESVRVVKDYLNAVFDVVLIRARESMRFCRRISHSDRSTSFIVVDNELNNARTVLSNSKLVQKQRSIVRATLNS
jgi:hypothetical protein